jgi:hypothetical protein
MEFKGIVRERDTKLKVIFALLAAYLMYREIIAKQYIYVPIACLVILACFFKKEHIVNEKGIDIKYNIFSITMNNYWNWNEITTIHADHRKAKPNVMIHIGKDITTRIFIMKSSEYKRVLEFAKRMNPNIFIEDLTEEEHAKREAEILRKQEIRKAQIAAAKAKRKKKTK